MGETVDGGLAEYCRVSAVSSFEFLMQFHSTTQRPYRLLTAQRIA